MKNSNSKLLPTFVGIDPGGWNKKTTGICLLRLKGDKVLITSKTIFGKNAIRSIKKILKDAKVITIEAPTSLGKGKGKMRLWEKYLSQKTFRVKGVSPLPPVFLKTTLKTSERIVSFLLSMGLKMDRDVIETFFPLLQKVVKKSILPKTRLKFKSRHELQAFFCSFLSLLHAHQETFFIGYKDGKLFLPQPKYWYKKSFNWFKKEWSRKNPYKYKFLYSNILD
jgi:predicted nuclease with RNAse H fold